MAKPTRADQHHEGFRFRLKRQLLEESGAEAIEWMSMMAVIIVILVFVQAVFLGESGSAVAESPVQWTLSVLGSSTGLLSAFLSPAPAMRLLEVGLLIGVALVDFGNFVRTAGEQAIQTALTATLMYCDCNGRREIDSCG